MKLIVMLAMMLLSNPTIREVSCVSQTKCDNSGVCATKWICPFNITFVEPKEVR